MLTISRWTREVERLTCMFRGDISRFSVHFPDFFEFSAILRIIHELETCNTPDKVN